MKERILGPAMALGIVMSATACGGDAGAPQEVYEAQQAILDHYDCEVGPAKITIKDLSEDSLRSFGDATIGKAVTLETGIVLDDNLTTEAMASLVIHETFHWCADRKTEKKYDPSISVGNGYFLTSSIGFVPILNNERANGNTFIEEGVVEWLATKNKDYIRHDNYAETAELTETITKLRNISDKQIIELLKNDDLLGLVAVFKNKPINKIDGKDLNDIVYLYMGVSDYKVQPTLEELIAVIGE